jgi:predicted metal-dependent hydrolase
MKLTQNESMARTRATTSKRKIEVVWRKVAEVTLQSRSPRKRTQKQVCQIAKSIKRFASMFPY